MTTAVADRIGELSTSRVPFVRATVVRAQDPTSARAGDQAIVLADGTIEGFVGGHCAAGSVRTIALDALASGTSVLLRILPEGETTFPESPGARVVVNPCLSGGALEIFLEPLLPAPALHLVGSSPVAEAVAGLAGSLGFVVDRSGGGAAGPSDAVATVVSTHGGNEASAVRQALDAGLGFVGVVCSRTRGKVLLAELDLTEDERARVHVHVGVDIGARTPPEIALSVMASVVRAIRLEGLTAALASPPAPRPVTATDPACGMTVTVTADTPHVVVDGTDYWFCNPGCREHFLQAQAS